MPAPTNAPVSHLNDHNTLKRQYYHYFTLQTGRLGDLPKLIQLVGSTAVIGIYIRLTPKPIIFSDYLLKYRLINHLFL